MNDPYCTLRREKLFNNTSLLIEIIIPYVFSTVAHRWHVTCATFFFKKRWAIIFPSYNKRKRVPDSYKWRETIPDRYKWQERVLDSYN